MTFDYYPDPFIEAETGITRYVHRPFIPIRLSYAHKMLKFPFNALLDSGADNNLFPAELCEHLGIKLKNKNYQKHIGIGSQGLDAYRHQVTIWVGSYHFQTNIDFAIGQQMPLLGRLGFFKFFKQIIFNERERKMTLEY